MQRQTNARSPHRNVQARRTARAGMMLLLAVLAGSGCAGGDDSPSASGDAPATIEQPRVTGLRVAPESARVDLTMPRFTNPTEVTNPLFPVSEQKSVLLVGRVDGEPFRTEVTLLPHTRIIEWQGRRVEVLVSQYLAFLDRRIHEVAYDFYAQADDGSVWYFGEDVFNFEEGVITDTHGTWIAGKDGPAAMIMPAEPRVGDVYRPENIPGFVLEEVTVKAVDQTLNGPLGPVEGGLVVEELHQENSKEEKTFAPGYGEFFTAAGGDVEALALAVPTDALSTPTPKELLTLQRGAAQILDAARARNWRAAQAVLEQMTAAWQAFAQGGVPRRIEPLMRAALDELRETVDARQSAQARQAAIDVAQTTLDLQLRHRPVTEIDLARFDLQAVQLLVDAEAGDTAAVNGDFFTLDYVRDRIQHILDEAERTRLHTELEKLGSAVGDKDLVAAASAAQQLRSAVAAFEPAR